MPTPTIKGRGVVKNADGTVSIAGVAQINTAQNVEGFDASEVHPTKDSAGKVQTLTVPENIKKVSIELIPGGTTATDATLAEAAAQGVFPAKLGTLILSNFKIASFNDTYVIIEDCPVKQTAGGDASLTVKGTKFERDFTPAPITV